MRVFAWCLVGLGMVALAAPGAAAAHDVTIEGFAFSPADVEVQVGDTVRWTNYDSARHSATSDADGENPYMADGWFQGEMGQGESFQVEITEARTYHYFCHFHPNMQGTITAVGPQETPTSSTPTSSEAATITSTTTSTTPTTTPAGTTEDTEDTAGTPGPGVAWLLVVLVAAGTLRRRM